MYTCAWNFFIERYIFFMCARTHVVILPSWVRFFVKEIRMVAW